MFQKIVLITLAIFCVSVASWTDCGTGNNGVIHAVRITNCSDNATTCVVYTGRTYHIEIDATSNIAVKSAKFKATTTILIKITLAQGDGCAYLTAGSCPIAPGDNITAAYDYTVDNNMPQATVTVTVTVTDDESNAVIACGQLQMTIRKG